MLQFTRSTVAVMVGACVLMLLAMGVVWALMPQRSVALAQELVDNPVYQSWAKGKPGTTVTLSQEIIAMGSMRRMDMTSKLVELTPAKAVVETTSKNIESNSQTTTKAEVRAKVKKQDLVGTLTMEPGIKVKLLPDEDVTVGGKTYKCKVFEWTGELRGMNTSVSMSVTVVPRGLRFGCVGCRR